MRIRREVAVAMVFAAFGLTVRAQDGDRAPGAGQQQTFVYHAIDVTGASITNAQGINARGDVVGFYVQGGVTHGFLLSDGMIATIDYPGAAYTDARGINAGGDIVGAYRMLGEPPVNLHGYLRNQYGEFTPLDLPGHTNTIAQRITSTGLIVGCRHDEDTTSTMRGIAMNARDLGQFAEIDAFASMNNGATPDGEVVVGLFTEVETMRGRGYLLYGETLIPFDVPGSTFTAAWDVNARGDVVGVYRNTAGVHGFLWANLGFTAIDVPGAAATRAFGINSRGDIVGTHIDAAGRAHGFVATALGLGRD